MAFAAKLGTVPGSRVWTSLFGWLNLCSTRRRERLVLAELNDHELRDIGLTRADADREAARLPWDGCQRGF